MGLTNDIAAALATKVSGIAGMRGCSPALPDTFPAFPWGVVGTVELDHQPGAMEVGTRTFTVLLLVGRVADDARTHLAVRDLLDAAIAALRSGISLSLSGSGVAQALLTRATDAETYTVGEMDYRAVTLTIEVSTFRPSTYTA